MQKILLLLGMLGICGLVLVALASRPPRRLPGQEPTTPEPPVDQDRVVSDIVEEQSVEALKMQLKKKDELIASLLVVKLQKAGAGEPVARANRPDPRMEAMRILDERMRAGSASSPDARQMNDAIRSALVRGVLASSATTELQCAGRLCRLSVSDDSQGKVELDTQNISESVGKAVGGIVVLEGAEREKILYLARSSDDLMLSPPTDTDKVPSAVPSNDDSSRQTL